VRAPDFAFVSKARILPGGLPKKFFPGAPDLAVEVLSPSDTTEEVDEKVLDWLGGGCQAVWVVDPGLRTVTIYHSPTDIRVCPSDGELADDKIVPGFRCKVSDLFAP
jgi:Uma2 family endonuclease